MSRNTRAVFAISLGALALAGLTWVVVSDGDTEEPLGVARPDERDVEPDPVRSPRTRPSRPQPIALGADSPDGSRPTPLRAVRPTSGEGAVEHPEFDDDPEPKVEYAIAQYETKLDEATHATGTELGEVLDDAATALSAVRSEMYASEDGKAEYLRLQRAIERARPG